MRWPQLFVEIGAVAVVGCSTWALPRAWRSAPSAAPPWWPWSEKAWFRASSAGPTCAVALWGIPFIWLTEFIRDSPNWVETISVVGSFWFFLIALVAVFVYATQRPRRFIPPRFRPVTRGESQGAAA
jgi:hypothetical protein